MILYGRYPGAHDDENYMLTLSALPNICYMMFLPKTRPPSNNAFIMKTQNKLVPWVLGTE